MLRTLTLLLIIGASLFASASLAQTDSIDMSVALLINETEVRSTGKAVYNVPNTLCASHGNCYMWGTHRFGGGWISQNWGPGIETYEKEIREETAEGSCYTGIIEGKTIWGFSDRKDTPQKCQLCRLTLSTMGSGSISGAPLGQSSYACGTTIHLDAVPASGWEFNTWLGSIASTSARLSFVLDGSKTLTADFKSIPDGSGSGTGGQTPENIDPGACNPLDGGCSPLILDLSGNGIQTTSCNSPVRFDLNGDGVLDLISWTRPDTEEGILYYDYNHNQRIDGGTEVFGDSTVVPGGSATTNGFEALALYDRVELGGDADGIISSGDTIWGKLRVWVDRNHDGRPTTDEDSSLGSLHIVHIDLSYIDWVDSPELVTDGSGNRHLQHGTFARRVTGAESPMIVTRAVHDVYFNRCNPTP